MDSWPEEKDSNFKQEVGQEADVVEVEEEMMTNEEAKDTVMMTIEEAKDTVTMITEEEEEVTGTSLILGVKTRSLSSSDWRESPLRKARR